MSPSRRTTTSATERAAALFTGDAVQGRGISYVNGPHALPPLYEDYNAYIATQERLKECEPQHLLSAHHDPKTGTDAHAFLNLSMDIARRGAQLVQQILTHSSRPMLLHDVAVELAQRSNAAEAEDFIGLLQFHVNASAHLADLHSHGAVVEAEPGAWRPA